MKFVVLSAPTLVELAFVVVLYSQAGRPIANCTLTQAQRNAEIRELHRKACAISARLGVLDSQTHQFLPRGMEVDERIDW
jgi:hypothetical protein